MHRNDRGFTFFEIVIVLLLLSIISGYVLGRSISTEQINLVGEVDKIRAHLRYAHSLAMKRNEVWGIRCTADPNQYWLFTGTDPDNAANQVNLPGEDNVRISLASRGITMNPSSSFSLFFDGYGIPYTAYTDESTNTEVSGTFTITITTISGSQSRTLTVTQETGLIR